MKKVFINIFLILFAATSIVAQSDQQIKVSLKQAQNYAYEHNITIYNGDIEIRKAYLARWQTLASMLPQVSGTLDYQNLCGSSMTIQMDESYPPVEIPLKPNGSLSVTAAMALSGTQIVGTLMQKTAIDMANISSSKNKQGILSSVANIYITILAMEQTTELLQQGLVNINRLYDIAQNAVSIGVTEQTDADQLFVQVASLQNTINNTKRTVEILYNSLRLQMGTDSNIKIILSDKLEDLIKIDDTYNLSTVKFNIENNFDYQLLKKSAELSEQQVTLSAMEYVPSATVFYQYSAKTYFGESSGMNMTPPNLVGVSISVPIWSSGVRTSKLMQSKLSNKIAQNNLYNTINALNIKDRQLKYNLLSAYENHQTQKKNIEISGKVFQNISNKYEYGKASSLDVTNASSNLISAQGNYIQSIIDLNNAKIELENLLNLSK